MKKHHAFIFLGAAALLWYANSQVANVSSNVTLSSPGWGQLAQIDQYPTTINASFPTLDIVLVVVGVFFFVKGE